MRTYLIVDDNREFADNLAEIVRDNGDQAVVATNGSQAIDLVQKRRFDALLTDMKMPVMGGAQLVHEIRRADPGLAAIVITAYTGESDLTIAKREGLLGILPKPVPMQQLLALLAVARRNGLVAVFEDDLELSESLAEALRERGFTAAVARSLTETDRLETLKPFAALVDLKIPGSADGEIFARISERFPDLPLIVMTGYPDLALASGNHIVYRKPFDTPEVLATLETFYQHREMK